jgi:dipeptidyl aminopeptidase/acylaminoacyl peptidase
MNMQAAVGLIALALLAAPPASGEARTATVRDLARIVRLADPHFSPDGRTVALVETRADLDSDKFQSEILIVDVASRQVRQLTLARHRAGSPRWSPTGERIGFLAPDSENVIQLFVMRMDGGDALQLTKGKDNVNQFAWSPDAMSIAYAVTDAKPELKGEDKFRTEFKVGNDDVTISEAIRPVHLWLISAQGGDPKRLTSGTWSLPSSLPPGPPSSPIAWSRDGKSILFVRQETPSTGDQFFSRIQVLDVASGQIRSLTGEAMLEGYPVPSPDGSNVAYWRNRDAHPWNYQDVWLAPFAGGVGRDISAGLDKNVFITRWAPNGEWMLVGGNVDTTVGLWRIKPDGAATPLNLGGVVPTNGYWIEADIARSGGIAFVGQTKADPYEIYIIAAEGGPPVAITQANAGLSDLQLARSETVTWKGPGGRTLDGVLTYPADYRAGARYPLVLNIHGGPNSSSRERFNLMPQVLASQGWIVFEPNYRGSDNLGQDRVIMRHGYRASPGSVRKSLRPTNTERTLRRSLSPCTPLPSGSPQPPGMHHRPECRWPREKCRRWRRSTSWEPAERRENIWRTSFSAGPMILGSSGGGTAIGRTGGTTVTLTPGSPIAAIEGASVPSTVSPGKMRQLMFARARCGSALLA